MKLHRRVVNDQRKSKNKGENLKKLNFASELYRSSDRRLSARLVPTVANRGCHVVSVADP
jgi:hypothetical protein